MSTANALLRLRRLCGGTTEKEPITVEFYSAGRRGPQVSAAVSAGLTGEDLGVW